MWLARRELSIYFDFFFFLLSFELCYRILVLVSHKNSLRLALSFDNKTDGGHICVAKLCKVLFSYFVLNVCAMLWMSVCVCVHRLRTYNDEVAQWLSTSFWICVLNESTVGQVHSQMIILPFGMHCTSLGISFVDAKKKKYLKSLMNRPVLKLTATYTMHFHYQQTPFTRLISIVSC